MQKSYPSLEDSCVQYDLGHKLDVIEKEYWSKGINTHEIPKDILSEYSLQDVELLAKLFQKQQQIQRPHQRKLFKLQCYDLLVLEEMEWHGSYYNLQKSAEKAKELDTTISLLQKELNLYHNVPNFNWKSPEHLSALLFGGTIEETIKVPNGFYKSGEKKGQIKLSKQIQTYVLQRKYKPLKGSELKKKGVWSVEEDHLLQLKGDKQLIEGLLKIRELEKLNNTYFKKLPTLHAEQHWQPGIIHTTFNQVTTRTGRLSSTKPNLQNLAPPAQELFESRWTSTMMNT
jgi:DNA polymerase I-like protein with 3'-5' exonuclease and polymerase domains